MNISKTLKVIGLILLIAAIYGGYVYPQAHFLATAVSPSGSTNSVLPASSIVIVPSTLDATSTSVLNTGGYDRMISSTDYACTSNTSVLGPVGAGYINFGVKSATTSVANQGLQGNTNFISSTTLSTTTPSSYIATSTEGVITGTSRIWPANTYLTFQFTATTSAQCTATAIYRNL